MAQSFVAINDPVHALLRQLTGRTTLQAALSPAGLPAVDYQVNPGLLPEAYHSLAFFHALGGLALGAGRFARWQAPARGRACIMEQAGYFDAVKLDRRCGRDLRLKPRKHGPGMLSAELLTFGTGVLRARNDLQSEPLQRGLWRRYGRLQTRHERVFATIRALPWDALPLFHNGAKETFDSTNLIYGDALGELEQLWERRADTLFLEQVARALQSVPGQAEVAAFLCPPLNCAGVVKMHVRAQARWKAPPANARLLLRRVEFILGHTTVDDAPDTVFDWRKAKPSSGPGCTRTQRPARERGSSGYDGWLQGGPWQDV